MSHVIEVKIWRYVSPSHSLSASKIKASWSPGPVSLHYSQRPNVARCPRMSLSGHLVLLKMRCMQWKTTYQRWTMNREGVGSRCINRRQLLGWASVTIYSTYCESVLGGPRALMMTTSLKMYFHHPISSWHHRVARWCWWIASQDWPLTMM